MKSGNWLLHSVVRVISRHRDGSQADRSKLVRWWPSKLRCVGERTTAGADYDTSTIRHLHGFAEHDRQPCQQQISQSSESAIRHDRFTAQHQQSDHCRLDTKPHRHYRQRTSRPASHHGQAVRDNTSTSTSALNCRNFTVESPHISTSCGNRHGTTRQLERHFYNVQPDVASRDRILFETRSAEVPAHRFRLGKCRLNSYLHNITLHDTGTCDSCGEAETIEHYLINCSQNEIAAAVKNICDIYSVVK